MRKAVQGAQCVLHQAAIASVSQSVEDPIEVDRVNVAGTLQVLQAARATRVSRVILASSAAVYGRAATVPAKEDSPSFPESPYGASKLAAENYCWAFFKVYGLETVCSRYFNVFGPRQDPTSRYAGVIPRFLGLMANGNPPTVYGDGQQSRDYVHASDVVEATLLAC